MAERGIVEVEMSAFHAKAFIRIIKHHQHLDDYIFTNPGRLRRNWDFFAVGTLRIVDYLAHPRLLELMSFWTLSNTTVGWQKEIDGKLAFGFLGWQKQGSEEITTKSDSGI